MKYLSKINSSSDVRELSLEQLEGLADDVRQEIISAVADTGGHLATNLGAVEMTLALHHVFDLPTDKLVWDVSHQVYAHKLLTGRREQFHTLRQYGGLAGFTKRAESDCDPYGAGHASTAISAALGIAAARDLAGRDFKVVAIIGDGSLTGGLAFEGLNNAGTSKKDLLVILNDNTWSISKNVGAMSKYLTNIMADEKFNRLRNEIWELTGRFKRRDKIRATISHIETSLKGLLVPGMLFQNLGFRYFGPIDGHDLPLVVKTLQSLKNLGGPIMLHLATKKGKGYDPAEGDPTSYHGIGKFDKVTGKPAKKSGRPSYTKVFGDTMLELAARDKRVIAITAAMATGTGLDKFAQEYPDRFYDVGIAEGHAGCFAGGLAAEGARPYMAVYSTFMQRAYDQIIHDIALQKLPVVFCMDRAGLVGEDGPTHHGAFDLSFLGPVPNLEVAVPKDGNELRSMLHYTIEHELPGPVAIRYPRAS
ncbi:MAG: 1-deoxy-D-xylulose-5-phosphate synthase, partial [candidate division Zixibacteria bacterium]|nr:1-deoxy-D-xylulose-5-phosphate synthase [candidate division Zixibacteria bacterium]